MESSEGVLCVEIRLSKPKALRNYTDAEKTMLQFIELLEKCPEFKSSEENNNLLISSIKSAYDIICAPNSTEMQKHEALRSVVDKIIYDKKNNALSLYFYVHD